MNQPHRWDMTPETIEDMMLALLDIEQYEHATGKTIGMTEAPIVTRALFKDIGQRVLRRATVRRVRDRTCLTVPLLTQNRELRPHLITFKRRMAGRTFSRMQHELHAKVAP